MTLHKTVTLSAAKGLWRHGEILHCVQNYGFFAALRMTRLKTVTLSEAKGLYALTTGDSSLRSELRILRCAQNDKEDR